ncbi:MAG: hypothetical protein OEM62_13310 [Acidobacteriota bacterium]|nr:hypothetical protein [Acidobacteriota bacterium]
MSDTAVLYEGLLEVAKRYLSEASVRAAVDKTLESRELQPHDLATDTLPGVVAEAMVGLRMFCDPEKLGDLMMDLAEYCEQAERPHGSG